MPRTHPRETRGPDSSWIPPLAALLLALPGFAFTWLWDDFDFLGRAQTFHPAQLLPDPRSTFWRPVSREIYFTVLYLLGPGGLFWAHLLNAAVLALIVLEVMWLGRRLARARAGFFSGIVFAGLGSVPILVGWVSGIQDLLAVALVLAALLLELEGKTPLALVAAALALLAKETAAVLLPVLALSHAILGRKPPRAGRGIALYGALGLAWAVAHPGIRALALRSLGVSEMDLGLGQPGRADLLAKSALALINLPADFRAASWPTGLQPFLLGAAAGVLLGLYLERRGELTGVDQRGHVPSPRRAALFALLIAVLPALAAAALVRPWAPYYLAMPGIGVALLLGVSLRNMPSGRAAIPLLAFLTLGVWSRGTELDPLTPTEPHLARSSVVLKRIESEFRALHPELPPRSRVYLSIQATGAEGLYTHLRRFQALRIWYRDPSILTLRCDQRVMGQEPEFLFWIGAGRNVVEVDLATMRPRSTAGKPEYGEYQRAIRSYALGLGCSGDTDRGVAMLLGLPKFAAADSILDRRLAAMMLLADGRRADAEAILGETPAFSREQALPLLAAVLAQPTHEDRFGESALPAFGFAPGDSGALRFFMRWLDQRGVHGAAARFARRLWRWAPGDPECIGVIQKAEHLPRAARLTTPISGDSL